MRPILQKEFDVDSVISPVSPSRNYSKMDDEDPSATTSYLNDKESRYGAYSKKRNTTVQP